MPPPSSAAVPSPKADVPHTRDRIETQAAQERRTPTPPALRFALDDGEPTVTGWPSPTVRESRVGWLWALGAGLFLVGLVTWFVYGP